MALPAEERQEAEKGGNCPLFQMGHQQVDCECQDQIEAKLMDVMAFNISVSGQPRIPKPIALVGDHLELQTLAESFADKLQASSRCVTQAINTQPPSMHEIWRLLSFLPRANKDVAPSSQEHVS